MNEEGARLAAFTEVVGKRPEDVQMERRTWAKGSRFEPASLREPGSDNPLASSRGMFVPR